MEILDQTFYHNSLRAWFWALSICLIVMLALGLARSFVARHLAKLAARTGTTIDDRLAEMLKRTKFFFIFVIAIYSGGLTLELPRNLESFLHGLMVVAVVLQLGLWISSLLTHVVAHYVEREIGDGTDAVGASTALNFVGRLLLWAALLLLALENVGWEVGPLLAGLGVGGIAVALAAQNLLGDLFASFSILFDKPFVIGDFIVVDEYKGNVERIGLKTTRLKSLSGEQLVISNADLLKSRIRNFKLMQERRVVFSIGVVYQTPYSKLKAIPDMVRAIVEAQRDVRFERAHFSQLGESALVFEVVYWVTNPDYDAYMDIQQQINLAIFQRFEEEGIEFAYPTRTVFVNGVRKAE